MTWSRIISFFRIGYREVSKVIHNLQMSFRDQPILTTVYSIRNVYISFIVVHSNCTDIIILPGTVLVLVPAAILLLARGTWLAVDFQTPTEFTFYLGIAIAAIGGYLAVRTAVIFTTLGEGTPAPWEPPKKLVIIGPYRTVRNPMITGAILILLGESVLFNSWLVFLWTIVFLVGKMIYFPLVEEKELAGRFGEPYREYRDQVPRWVPRFRRWDR